MSPTNPELRQFITQFFNDEELETLCFDYFPEALNDFGGGMSKNRKVMRLIEYCVNRDKLNELNTALFHERQDVYWERFHQIPDKIEDVDRYVEWLKSLPDKVFPGKITQGPPPKPDSRIHEKTGIELVRVPAGPFFYGSSENDPMAKDNEKPQRTIDLPEYLIGLTPVTNAQFSEFIQVTGYITTAEQRGHGWGWTGIRWDNIPNAQWRQPRGLGSSIAGKENHPVVQVSWKDAKAFCEWAELVLPREEEWEKAARGKDTRIWPWGNDLPTSHHCNFNRNIGGTTPVGRYSPIGDSPYGCTDMAGNVWEWTESQYENETMQIMYVLRGGSWDYNQRFVRVSARSKHFPDFSSISRGFRVAAQIDTDS